MWYANERVDDVNVNEHDEGTNGVTNTLFSFVFYQTQSVYFFVDLLTQNKLFFESWIGCSNDNYTISDYKEEKYRDGGRGYLFNFSFLITVF